MTTQDSSVAVSQVRSRDQDQGDANTSQGDSPASKSSQQEEKRTENTDEESKKKGEEKHHQGAIVVAPLPIVSPAIGSGFIPVLGYIFPFEDKDKAAPPSVIGGAGLITNNGSRGFGLGADLFMKENRYEFKALYARGNINYDLYGVGFLNGNSNLKLPLVQTGQILFVEFLRNIGWKVFVGPRFVNGTSFITINPSSVIGSILPPNVGLHTNLRAVGFRAIRDSRINRFYATQGMLLDFTADFFSQGLGSKYSFQS